MAEPKSLRSMLSRTLQSLSCHDFKYFKLFLKDKDVLVKFEVIQDELKTKDRCEILEAMMDNYGVFTINVMKNVLKEIRCNLMFDKLSDCQYDPEVVIAACKKDLQSTLKSRFQFLKESLCRNGAKMLFDEGYTELFITEADTGQVIEEHEVRQMERFRTSVQERTVLCQDIFRGSTQTEEIRAVLTKGVAGVGKTVLTQKFSLDWAEGRDHQDVQLLFHFTFRDLNVLQGSKFSLVGLIHRCFKDSKKLFSFQCLQLLFILDGLDECRPPLDFSRTRVLTEPTESASVEELLVNLIRGDLLPSARLWITTRPAAANQIPAECVSMVTEVRGFSDAQKEQYFRKRFLQEQQADTIISHVKSIRSLYIMSSIPIFCWIISTILQDVLKQTQEPELPKTLTEMYVHFLVFQAKVKNIKYHGKTGADRHWTPETKKMVKALGKLAFEQLLKGKLIFTESDVRECVLDAEEIARYSGVFTEIFREERGLYENKVYCFVHLTVQEFLAALHVHQTFFSSGENLLSPPQHFSEEMNTRWIFHYNVMSEQKPTPKEIFYRSAVERALESPNGHLDLFLRFLLGLSLSTNQELLPGQLTHTGSDQTNQKTVKYIRDRMDTEALSAERSLNLFHCLNELKERSLLEEVQKLLRDGRSSCRHMSPAEWSALCFLLLSSDSDLEEFDLRKYHVYRTALVYLLPVIKASTKAILRECLLTEDICGPLSSVLSSSSLTLLDLSNNDLQDSGVERLCEGLKSAPCRLDTLRLSGCLVSERGGASLATALSSTPSCLRELDLSYNHPGSSTELLTALLAPHSPLQTLRLDPAGERWMVPGLRKYSCEFSLDPNTAHRRLRLSEDRLTVSLMKEEQLDPPHDHRSSGDLAVFLDSEAGSLSFYQVDPIGRLIHLHTVLADFSEPLFPGFGLRGRDLSVSVMKRQGTKRPLED